jgi:hypothetical protein
MSGLNARGKGTPGEPGLGAVGGEVETSHMCALVKIGSERCDKSALSGG